MGCRFCAESALHVDRTAAIHPSRVRRRGDFDARRLRIGRAERRRCNAQGRCRNDARRVFNTFCTDDGRAGPSGARHSHGGSRASSGGAGRSRAALCSVDDSTQPPPRRARSGAMVVGKSSGSCRFPRAMARQQSALVSQWIPSAASARDGRLVRRRRRVGGERLWRSPAFRMTI